jgi:hypothetical protein
VDRDLYQVPVVLYGCETWSLTLREEHTVGVFGKRELRGIFGYTREEEAGEKFRTRSFTIYRVSK